MKGFIVLNRTNGDLIYSKYFNSSGELSKEESYQNTVFDGIDPSTVAK